MTEELRNSARKTKSKRFVELITVTVGFMEFRTVFEMYFSRFAKLKTKYESLILKFRPLKLRMRTSKSN